MNRKVVAALALLVTVTGWLPMLAQEAPLPQVQRRESPPVTVSSECNEPPVPEAREPLVPGLVARGERPPVEAEPRPVPTVRLPDFEPAELIPPARESELSAPAAMALLRKLVRSGSYEDFKQTLAIANRKVDAMPGGDEKRAFTDALQVYADIDELWNYAMTHRMGAFYNDTTFPGFFLRLTSKYPRYGDFIAPQAVRDSAGNRLYPTTETRHFLADEAERRLRGIRLPPPPSEVIAEREPIREPAIRVEPERPTVVPPTTRPTERPAVRPPTTRPTERPAVTPPAPRPTERPRVVRPAPTVKPPVETRRAPTRPPSRPVTPRPRPEPPGSEEPTSAAPPSATTPPVTAAPPPTATSPAEPIEEPSVTAAPSTAVVPPATTRPAQPRPAADERPSALPSSTTLLLLAFGVIALIAIALIVRAIRPRQAAAPLIPPPGETPPQGPPPDSDWIDPETRHWIDDVNKGDKPPN